MTLPQRKSPQEIQSEWQARLRDNAPLLQSDKAPPQQLHFLASLYFGHSAWAVGESAQQRLQRFLEDDDLAKLALDALAHVPSRPDLPSVQEAFELSARNRMSSLAWPLLAGYEECSTRGSDAPLPDDRLRQVLAIHALYDPASNQAEPEWHRWAVTHKPPLVAETVVSVYKAALRCNRAQYYGLHELAHDPAYAEVARLSVPTLLRTFPTRARSSQLGMLTSVLAAALSHCDENEFCAIVDSKLAAKSMGARQKMHWACAGFLRRPATYLSSLKRELEEGAAQRRVRYAADFLGRDGIRTRLAQLNHIGAAKLLIERIGPTIRYPAYGTNPGETVVSELIDVVAKTPTAEATALLQALLQDPALAPWHERLGRAARDQRNVRRNMEFRYPPVCAILGALAGGTPANAGDLAALAYDELATLGREIRDGQTSDWRQYWRTECEPQAENDCRDRLLSDLRPRLARFKVTADKEPTYADENRADIRISYDHFNVPIEIKKSNSTDLWTAIPCQLIPKYMRDPAADGHGIFLVFWFGQQSCKSSSTHKKPASAASLQKMLVDSLVTDVSHRIMVLVIDVEAEEP